MNERRSPYLFYLFRLPDKSRLTLDISIESVSSYNPEYTHLTHISLLLSANDPRPPLARTPAIMLIICCPSRSELKRKRACKRATRADCVGYSLTHSIVVVVVLFFSLLAPGSAFQICMFAHTIHENSTSWIPQCVVLSVSVDSACSIHSDSVIRQALIGLQAACKQLTVNLHILSGPNLIVL